MAIIAGMWQIVRWQAELLWQCLLLLPFCQFCVFGMKCARCLAENLYYSQ